MREGTFAAFVPELIARREPEPGSPPGPDAWPLAGAVLMIDLTGFTELTERLGRQGPGGAEVLADVVNAAFDAVIRYIDAWGGDIVAFAGDAVQAIWPSDGASSAEAVRRATAAGLAAQEALAMRPPAEGVTMRARAGVDVGDMWVSIVGGHGDEWRWVVLGSPLGGAGAAAGRGAPGELVLTGPAAAAAGLAGRPVEVGSTDVVVSAADASAPDERPAVTVDDGVAALLPRELVSMVAAGRAGWLAEFRHVTAAFIGIHDLDVDAPSALDLGQAAFQAMQAELDHYGGSLNRVIDDEKGLIVIAGWGLPASTHEDDAVRAALATRAIVDALARLGLRASAGLASGSCFAGIVGSASRAEYTMFGDAVNLAARLMQSSADDVRCDAVTAAAVGSRVGLRALGPLALKGKSAAIEVFGVDRPLAATVGRRRRRLVGRAGEWQRLVAAVAALRDDGASGVVVVEGEPGIGKSELLAQLARVADGTVWQTAAADAIERSTGYYIWRSPLLGLLGVDGDRPAEVEAAVRRALADDPTLQARAPLLAAVLPVELPIGETLAGLEADVRAEAVRSLVVELVSAAARETPVVLVLDDAHWMDTSSWALALEVARRAPGVLLVLGLRPMGEDAPVELARLLAEPGAVQLHLGPLGAQDVEDLVADGLGVESLRPEVTAFIEERAEGNPFFSEQLALALRDAGHLVLDDGEARAAAGVDLRSLDVPDTVRGVVAGRIDRLAPDQQLTLKVASVVGRQFRYRVLADVHPVIEDRPRLPDHLDQATRLDLTRLEVPEPDLAYLFTHVITQEVAYDHLVFAQRRPLHRAVAEWYEANVDDLAPLVPLLAHHWVRAGDTERALEYLGRAGEAALLIHANAEAITFLAEALELDATSGRPTPPEIRADWERWSGIAHIKLGGYRDALPHFEAALDLLGAPNPRGRVGRMLSIVRHLVVQAGRRVHHPRLRVDERERALAVSECHRYLAESSYWHVDLPRMVHAMLASLTHAEPAGDSKELVVAHASVGFLFGLVQLPRPARRHRGLATAAGERVGNPDAAGYAAELEAVYGLVTADWSLVEDAAGRAAAIFREIDDRMRWHTCFSLIGYADLHHGHFDAARPCWREGLDVLGPDGHLQGRLWSLAALLANDLAQDRPTDEVVGELAALLGPEVHHHDVILVRGLLAVAAQRAGDPDVALDHARAVLPLVEEFPPPSWHTMLAIAGVCDVLTELGERREARRAVRAFRRFARFNHAGRPGAEMARGRLLWLAGDRRRARRAWARARSRAGELDLPYEAARADLELAASHPVGVPARRSLAEGALAVLVPLGADHDAERARALLDEGVSAASAPG